jgi:hypothetical protein
VTADWAKITAVRNDHKPLTMRNGFSCLARDLTLGPLRSIALCRFRDYLLAYEKSALFESLKPGSSRPNCPRFASTRGARPLPWPAAAFEGTLTDLYLPNMCRSEHEAFMRAAAGFFAALAAMASMSLAAPPSDRSPIYLRGYYRIYDQYSIWKYSDSIPWYVVKGAPWADSRLVKWGYVPVTHDSKQYYCLIDRQPHTGSNILEPTFTCGDPATVEELYDRNRGPIGLLYGAP